MKLSKIDVRTRGRVTVKALMRYGKRDLVHFYLSLLDGVGPASADASAARIVLRKSAEAGGVKLSVVEELGLLRRWYEGSKHLIGSDS